MLVLISSAPICVPRDPARDRLLSRSTDPVGNSPQEFAAFIKREHEKWARVIKQANVRLD